MASKIKEEEFLQKCFVLLSKFSYEKLKETLEKEKEDCKTHTSLVWSQFLSLLISYADYEKSFYSLSFLGASNFGVLFLVKKETALKTKYNCLLAELRKIEVAHKDLTLDAAESPDSSFQSIEQMVSVIGTQLQHFVVARVNTICFYEQLTALTSNKNVSIDDLLKIITATLEEFLGKVNHPLVDCFKKTFRVECEAIINLLKTQAHLQKCVYFDSLMSLLTAGNFLTQWDNLLSTTKEGKKLTFMNSSNKVWTPELHDWLVKLKGSLLSKFNLYFFEVLSRHGTVAEVKATMAKAPIDYVSRIASFFKKADVCKVLLVLTNLKDLGEKSRRQGYFLPSRKAKGSNKETVASKIHEIDLSSSRPTSSVDESKSLSDECSTSSRDAASPVPPDSLVIFEHPSDKQDKSQTTSTYLLAIEELLSSKAMELEGGGDKVVCASDPKSLQTYAMTKIEGTIVLVVVLNRRHVKPDAAVTNFLASMSSDLRCNKLFMSLKPGSK